MEIYPLGIPHAVTNMSGMFGGATAFNQNIGAWDTADIITMRQMFYNASSFNQDISGWVTLQLTNTKQIFIIGSSRSSLLRTMGILGTRNVTDMTLMFYGATSFNSQLRYLPLQSSSIIQGINSNITITVSSNSSDATSRATLTSAPKNWNITDLGNEASVAPTFTRTTIASNNTTIAVTFNEAVYNAIGGSGALEASDFTLSISGGVATVNATPSSISISGNVYTLGLNSKWNT